MCKKTSWSWVSLTAIIMLVVTILSFLGAWQDKSKTILGFF